MTRTTTIPRCLALLTGAGLLVMAFFLAPCL